MRNLDFIVSSVIIARYNVLTLHISKTNFQISSLNVREIKLN